MTDAIVIRCRTCGRPVVACLHPAPHYEDVLRRRYQGRTWRIQTVTPTDLPKVERACHHTTTRIRESY
jgi:hypothetical protein